MLFDGLSLSEGATISNLTIASGTSNPASPTTGELFYRTDSPNEGLYVYNGTTWDAVGAGDVSFDSLNVKPAVRAATTANITLSGTQTIDGVVLVAGDRVLVKNQNTGSQNGIYVVASGAWTRSTDFDGSPSTEVKAGDFVFVTEGTTNADTGWVLATNSTITVGTTSLTFAQFSGSSAASSFTTLTGSNGSSTNTITTVASTSGSNDLFITVGDNTANTPGALTIQGGASIASFGTGGTLTLRGGTGAGGGSTTGGNIFIRGSLGTGSGGSIVFTTAATTSDTERFRITNQGVWQLAGQAGTSGQVLTSNGSGSAPTWQAVSVPTSISVASISASNSGTADLAVSVIASTNASNTGISLTGGRVNGTTNAAVWSAGAVTIQGGLAVTQSTGFGNVTGGHVIISGGNQVNQTLTAVTGSNGTGGDVRISGGTGTNGGSIQFSTTAGGTTLVERFRILNNGAWSVGSNGTSTGTSGQVLTSNGSGSPPTWQAVSASTATNISGGTTNQIPYQTAASTTTFSGDFTWSQSLKTLSLSAATTGGTVTITTGSGGAPRSLVIDGGAGNQGNDGSSVTIKGGDGGGGTGSAGGSVTVAGGGAVAGNFTGGTLTLRGGTSVAGSGGPIIFQTSPTNSVTERFRILNNGAWSVGSNGTSTGTSGQVLTSNGSSSPPTWQAAAAPTSFGNTSTFGDGTAAVTLQAPQSASAAAGTNLTLRAGTPSSTNDGGTLTLKGGNATTLGLGGDINITSGDAAANARAGNITIAGGTQGNSSTRQVTTVRGSDTTNNYAGDVVVRGGDATSAPGRLTLRAGNATAANTLTFIPDVNINGGNCGSGAFQDVYSGNVYIAAGNITSTNSQATSQTLGSVIISSGTANAATGPITTGYVSFRTGTTSVTERARVKANGAVRFVPMAEPSSAEAGDVYYDSTSNKLRCYNGSIWNDLF